VVYQFLKVRSGHVTFGFGHELNLINSLFVFDLEKYMVILFLFIRKDYIKCSSLFCFFFITSYPVCRDELLIRFKDE